MCSVTIMDKIRRELGVMRDLAGRMENCVQRWFGHVEHMGGESIAKDV